MNTVFLHIGYPKCLSTSIQRSYFSKHSQIHFAGIGIKDNISYSNNQIEFCFESLLKYSSELFWVQNKNKARESILQWLEKSNGKVSLFSSEHLSMNFSLQGIDNRLKYERLQYLLKGFDIKIIIIKRNVKSLIRSLYGEYLKMGYNETYEEFLKWLIVFKDRNFLPDLNFNVKHNQLVSYFGENNIHWISFESIIENGIRQTLNQFFNNLMNIQNENLEILNNNPSFNSIEQTKLLNINKIYPRGLGKSQTEPFERHRSRLMYINAGISFDEEEIFSNVIGKRNAYIKMKEMDHINQLNHQENFDLEEKVIEIIQNFSL